MLGRDKLMELHASNLPSAPPQRTRIEQPEYSSEIDGSTYFQLFPRRLPAQYQTRAPARDEQ